MSDIRRGTIIQQTISSGPSCRDRVARTVSPGLLSGRHSTEPVPDLFDGDTRGWQKRLAGLSLDASLDFGKLTFVAGDDGSDTVALWQQPANFYSIDSGAPEEILALPFTQWDI
jgi:hypothetical protein